MPPAREPQDPVPDDSALPALGVLMTQIQQVLSDELRISRWRGHPNHLAGHCYTASEALYHLGGREAGFRPLNIKHEGTSHWCLKRDDGTIIDPTVGQFITVPRYERGTRRGFLTKQPSRRAQTIIDRLCGEAELAGRAEPAEAEAAWRKRAMGDAKDALACGDGPVAWCALNRHEPDHRCEVCDTFESAEQVCIA